MRRIRCRMATALGGAMAALAVSALVWTPASAQVDLRALRQQNEIRQQQEIARQNALAAQREASAAQNRQATQMTLRALDASASPPAEPTLRPALPVAPRGPDAADPAIDAAHMDLLIDQRLAEGNARLRAITPAR